MTAPRTVTAKFADFCSDGTLVVHGDAAEHLIVNLGPAQIIALKHGLDKYMAYYEAKEIQAATS